MSITIDLPPAVVQAVMAFAESRHTTLERMVSDYLGGELLRSREVHSVLSRLDELTRKTDGRLSGEPYRFRRADAYGTGGGLRMTFLDSNVFVYFADGRDSAAPWRSRSPAGYSSTIRFFSPPRKQTNAARL